MNIIRNIYSLKVIIVFALVALFMASVTITPAEARRRHIVTCPCPFAKVYDASIAQSKALYGTPNKAGMCIQEDVVLGGYLALFGETAFGETECTTLMQVYGLNVGPPSCQYLLACQPPTEDSMLGYTILFPVPQNEDLILSPEEVKACRAELKLIAWLSHLLPCQPPPT